ncbi:MAG: TonB-dependent receptor domain-containing protein, partial [bacterium]
FSFSCRYDDYTSLYGDFRSIIVPQLSLIRVEKSKALKLVYSQNYRPPSISESYYNDGGISEIANPNLAPEKHKTWHLIYYQELKRKNLKGYFSLGFYFTNIEDIIDEVNLGINSLGINVIQYQNVEDIEILGGIMDYVVYFEDKEFFRISYSYSNARTLKNFSFLSNSPQSLFLLKYAKRISQDLWVSFENKYTSSALDNYGIKVGGYNITNFNFIYELKEGNLTLSIHNIFDVKASNVISLGANYPVSVYPVKPRTIYLNLVKGF